MRRTPALIIGGGPAGAAAAILLARAGRPHLLIERQASVGDALCGGFLSWRTLESLTSLGIDADALNPANVDRVRLFAGEQVAEAPLPRPAKGVSRRRLDSIMIAAAVAEGAVIERGNGARQIDGHRVRMTVGDEIEADALFLATGKHDLRGLARPAEARGADPTLGIRIRLGPAPELTALVGDAIELHLFDRGYAGLVLQEDGSANLCLAVHRSRLAEAGSPAALLDQLAGETIALGARMAWRDAAAPIDAIANVPYGWRVRYGESGLFRLGDQAGVIPSLAGEGMGIAIASGIRAAQAYVAGGGAASIGYQRRLAADLARPIGLAGLIRGMAEHPRLAAMMIAVGQRAPVSVDWAARLTRISHSPIDERCIAVES